MSEETAKFHYETSDVEWRIRRLICDACMSHGDMVATGEALMSMPPQYAHRCRACSRQITLRDGERFPCMEFRVLGTSAWRPLA